MARFLSALVAHVVAAETVLLRDPVASLDLLVLSLRTMGRDGAEDLGFVAEFQTDDSPGILRFFGVSQDFETGNEVGLRDQVGT